MAPTSISPHSWAPVRERDSTPTTAQDAAANAGRATPSGTEPLRTPVRGTGSEPARRRILVVDDDSLIGRYVANVLEGYDVVFAQSAAGALGRVASSRRGFAAIICDLHMPGMDGITFHDEIARLDPALARRVLFVTGWAEAPEFVAFRKRTACAWLPKPFAPRALLSALERACEQE